MEEKFIHEINTENEMQDHINSIFESESGLSAISFGDKHIKIAHTENFTLYLICSELNPIISNISSILTQEFQIRYSRKLEDAKQYSIDDFSDFELIIKDIIKFAPLSQRM